MSDPIAALRSYLRSRDEKPSAFAVRAEINESTLFHILSGRRSPGLEKALAIERATGGKVPASAWVTSSPSGRGRRGTKAA